MRLLMRSQTRAATAHAASGSAPRAGGLQTGGFQAGGDERRAWIEALFGDHLPRSSSERDRAIEVLVGDAGVWRMLHQARHSMAETSATIERLARGALAGEVLQAA